MTKRYILIIDAGTSALQCHLFDANGSCVTQQRFPWPLAKQENDHSLAREFDAGKLWETLCSFIKDILIDANVGPMQVEAIGVTSQRQGVAFLDKDHSELYVGPNMDLRAIFEGATIDQDHADNIYSTTGHLPSFFFTSAKLRWFQIHRNHVYKNIAYVLPIADWITFKLTENLASERSLAGEAGHLNITRGDWASTLTEQFGVTINKGLKLVDPGHTVGVITPLVANQTGLSTDTPVVICGADTQVGLMGLGAWDPGDVGIVAGWSSPLQMVTSKPVFSPEAATWAGWYAAPNKWVLESSGGDIGNGYSWLVNTIWGKAAKAYAQADMAAKAIPPGAEGTLAVLGPSRMDMRRLGLFTGGLLFPTPVSFHQKSRGHLIRASLEAGAYTIRANLEQTETLSGGKATTIAIGGGMSKSAVFVTILANVLGRNVSLSKESATSAFGAYLCTSTTQGHFTSLRSAIASARDRLDLIEFQNNTSQEYDVLYKKWLETVVKLKGIDL